MYALFAMKDCKAGSFDVPFAARNIAVMARDLQRFVAENPKHIVATNPNDFQVWKVGEFDETTGEVRLETGGPVVLGAVTEVAGLNG